MKVVELLLLLLLLTLAGTRPAAAQVPTASDVAVCNAEAPQAVRTGTAAPIGDDHARADHARGGAAPASIARVAAGGVDSPDPQIHGMEAEGAKHATYQAAYRTCMRRKGF
jgi:hypothetical protein